MVSCPKHPLAESTQRIWPGEIKRHISKAEHLSRMDEALGQVSYKEEGGGEETEIK